MSTETILVVGATGLLGEPVARQLHQDGFKVRVLARDLERRRHSWVLILSTLSEMLIILPRLNTPSTAVWASISV